MVGFKLPQIEENVEGWGPTGVPTHLKDVPFMPYSKGDRLGRIADFGQMAQQRNFQGRYRDQMSGPAVFNFEKAEEEESFQLIDNKPVKKPPGMQQRRGQGGRWGQGGRGWGQQDQRGEKGEPKSTAGQQRTRAQQQQQRRQQGQYRPWDQPRAQYTSSVDIRPEWHVIGDQINFSALQKLATQAGQPEDLASCGDLAQYDKAADRVTPKLPAKLRRTAARTRSTTTSEDPILRRLAAEGAGQVFMTDALLTTIMCAPRSVYPWDIVITRRGGQLFFDKRANSSLDFLTNGETAPDPLPEEKDNVNGVQSLSVEATAVNQAFREQVLAAGAGERHSLGQPCPAEMAGHANAGYKYRKWSLGGTDLVVRCEVDGAIKLGDSQQLLAVHALNEFDPKWSGVDWRQKLENQRGAVLATELKNNANKMAKWTAAALLSGVDLIKLGYIARVAPKDNRNHVVLGTQAVKPRDFAMQMNLNMDNCWGIVRALVDLCKEKLEADGKYLLVKDPNKPQLRIYAVPAEEVIDSQYTEAAGGDEEDGAGEGGKAGDEE
ncbi:hypothetical protein N2152v2_007268 [Parachlorella kessleri]